MFRNISQGFITELQSCRPNITESKPARGRKKINVPQGKSITVDDLEDESSTLKKNVGAIGAEKRVDTPRKGKKNETSDSSQDS